METIKIELTGTTPIMLSNDRMVEAINPYSLLSKELTSSRKKTTKDHENINRLQWEAALYVANGKIVIPTYCIHAAIKKGGTMNKNGTKISQAVMIEGLENDSMNCTLDYSSAGIKICDDLKNPDDLKAEEIPNKSFNKLYGAGLLDGRSVVMQRARIWKIRPKFPAGWKVQFQISFDDSVIARDEVLLALNNAGKYFGMMAARILRFGRFDYQVF